MDLALTDTLLLTMRDDQLGIVEDGALGIADGELVYVGPADGLDPAGAERVLDAEGCVTTPGLVDVHAHTSLALLRGAAQDLPEIEWMRRGLAPFADRMGTADAVAGSRLGVLESVASGVTTVCEYATGVEQLVEAVHDPLGVRTVAVETISEVGDGHSGDPDEPYPFDPARGDAAVERAEALHERYADHHRVSPAYGPQALDMVAPDRLERLHHRAIERDSQLHVHVAQGEREARQVAARYDGASTVEVLERLDVVDDRLVAAHLHGATPDERARLADAGVSMAACHSSIAAIDGVVPPAVAFHDHGGIVGLGTDQAPGPGGHDLRRELRTAALLAKTDAGDPTALPAWRALRLATVGGAAALDLSTGRLEEGRPADVAVFEPGLGAAPTVSEPLHTAVPNLVYGEPRARHVVVAGDPVVVDGEFSDVDPEATVDEADERAAAVLEEGRDDWRAAGSELVSAVDEGWL